LFDFNRVTISTITKTFASATYTTTNTTTLINYLVFVFFFHQTTFWFLVRKSGSRLNLVVNLTNQLSKTFLGTTKCSVSFPVVKLFKKFHKSKATRCANNSLLPLIFASFERHSSSGSKETPIDASS